MPSAGTRQLLVLGSGSPRRREILESLRIPHVVFAAAIDEQVLPEETPDAYLVRVVRAKLAAVRAALPADLRARATAILVADTSVIARDPALGEIILGKPGSSHETVRMIMQLAGTSHEVLTRFAIASVGEGDAAFVHEETVRTQVTFRAITKARAVAYVDSSDEGMDKAGGYAVQGLAGAFVSRIEGSYSNVVGLPACEVSMSLERLGLV